MTSSLDVAPKNIYNTFDINFSLKANLPQSVGSALRRKSTACPTSARGRAPTGDEAPFDEREPVAGAEELELGAGEGATLAAELGRQRARAARPARELEPATTAGEHSQHSVNPTTQI